MKRIRLALNAVLGAGMLLGLLGLSGCSNDGAGSAPEKKGTRDQVQKARETSQVGDAAPVKKPGGR